jgi:hypothetical protein
VQEQKIDVNFSSGSAVLTGYTQRIRRSKQMDITRLPVTPIARPVTASSKTAQPAASREAVEAVEVLTPRQRTRDSFTRVVQGELLQRERTPYQSTQAFVNERKLERAQSADGGAESLNQSRSAIAQYLNNTRPEPRSELTQGRSINFFV